MLRRPRSRRRGVSCRTFARMRRRSSPLNYWRLTVQILSWIFAGFVLVALSVRAVFVGGSARLLTGVSVASGKMVPRA